MKKIIVLLVLLASASLLGGYTVSANTELGGTEEHVVEEEINNRVDIEYEEHPLAHIQKVPPIVVVPKEELTPTVEPPIEPPEEEVVVEEPVDPIYFLPSCPLSPEIQQMIGEKSAEKGIDFAFTMAIIFCESSFRPDAISYNNTSYGLMQINKCNHEWLSGELGITDFFDPEQNVTAGLYMLGNLVDIYGDDLHKILMVYNMGGSGAQRAWNKGTYTTAYSRKVISVMESYIQEMSNVVDSSTD